MFFSFKLQLGVLLRGISLQMPKCAGILTTLLRIDPLWKVDYFTVTRFIDMFYSFDFHSDFTDHGFGLFTCYITNNQ